DLYKSSPDVFNKLGDKIFTSLPQGMQTQLKSIGLDQNNFKEAGQALPKVLQLTQDLGGGDPKKIIGDINDIKAAAPDLLGKLGTKIYSSLPQGMKDTFNKFGINEKNIGQAWDSLPHVLDLQQHLSGSPPDVGGAINDLNAIGKAAPDLLKQVG